MGGNMIKIKIRNKAGVIIAATVAAVVLASCGKNNNDTQPIDTETAAFQAKLPDTEEVEEIVYDTEEIMYDTQEPETQESATDPNVDKSSRTDEYYMQYGLGKIEWLSDHEISITPQGDGILPVSVGGEDLMIPYTVSITETTEGVKEGMKKITATFTIDTSANPESIYNIEECMFDRYTGTDLEYNCFERLGESGEVEAYLKWLLSDYETMEVISENDYGNPSGDIHTTTKTIICPESYDGAVFYIGYRSEEMINIGNHSESPDDRRVSLIDELPSDYNLEQRDRYFCYTLSNQ